MKPYISIIPLVIYPFNIVLFLDQKDFQVTKYFKDNGFDEEDYKELLYHEGKGISGMFTISESNHTFIRLQVTGVDKCRLQGNIAHEAFHATTLILERVGVVFSMEHSDEAYAYLIGYLVQEINKRISLAHKMTKQTKK